ncbi:GntR family transcriptional regulator [Acidocella facilis]|uniref:GntR family transcriptional regulator n=1 Tax=Acidocella facilis TaxID=525 RepID=UPI000689B259|nr:GntR family transcriptional regulator [Acidocella facilis]
MMPTDTARAFVFDRTRQAAPQIADFLREQILSLEIAPGTIMSRAELQVQFGVSQTPVRDALLKLEEEGLVTVYPQYATLVSKVNLAQAKQAHFMRRALEADIAGLLASRPTPAMVNDLRKANARVKVEAQAQDLTAFLVADRDFHRLLYLYADMMQIFAVMRAHSGHLDRLRRLNIKNVGTERIIRQHEEMIDAIEAGKPEEANAKLREHLANTLATLEQVAADYPEFVE